MNKETRSRLNAINRAFYEARAPEFSATRLHPWPGWQRVLTQLREARGQSARETPLDVLDVGCGNGRFALFLASHWPTAFRYLGVDVSPALLAIAQEATRGLTCGELELRQLDVLESRQREALAPGPFDLVVAFGLLHHVPGFAERRSLLQALADRVAERGILAATAWRFGSSPRFAGRSIPWESYNRDTAWPIDTAQLEPGDHLLAFGQSQRPARYCHHSDDEELERLLAGLALEELDCFDADGRSGDLNRYLVLGRPG